MNILVFINGLLIGVVCIGLYIHHVSRKALSSSAKSTDELLDKVSAKHNELVQAMQTVEAKVHDFQLRLDMRGSK